VQLVTEQNRKWWTVVAMALTTLLTTIDFNGLTVALPSIGRDLGVLAAVLVTDKASRPQQTTGLTPENRTPRISEA
jgi:hypothetical protein